MNDEELNNEIENEEVVDESSSETTDSPKKSNSLPMVVVVIALLVLGGVFLSKNMKSKNPSDDATNSSAKESVQTPTGPVKEFIVDGSNFKFDPSVINVNKGDNVKITFKDDDGMHNLVVDGYNVQTETIKSGAESSVTFLADKAGTFDYYCSVGSHREKGMTGKLTVQ